MTADGSENMVENTRTAGFWPNLYEPLRNIGQRVADWFAPRSEASAMQDYYEINVELPGVKPDDVEVSVHENSLMVRGERKFERREEGRTFFFSEIEYGSFQRTFRLPADADSDKIDAAFTDGVLNLRIAKASPSKPAGKKISVRRA
jgi:HSP20 family protein